MKHPGSKRGTHRHVHPNPLGEGPEGYQSLSRGFQHSFRREAILDACDKFQANLDFQAQHGAVKVLVKDGKPAQTGLESGE